jgi:arsenate reductase
MNPTQKRILFLCTGNAARSQMAEAFLRKFANDYFEVYSAGLEPKGINPLTIQVLEEKGLDLSQHASKSVQEYLGKVHFHKLITVCDDAEKNCPTVWPGVNERMHWSFEDPAAFEGAEEEKIKKFRVIRDQIEQKILEWLRSENVQSPESK